MGSTAEPRRRAAEGEEGPPSNFSPRTTAILSPVGEEEGDGSARPRGATFAGDNLEAGSGAAAGLPANYAAEESSGAPSTSRPDQLPRSTPAPSVNPAPTPWGLWTAAQEGEKTEATVTQAFLSGKLAESRSNYIDTDTSNKPDA